MACSVSLVTYRSSPDSLREALALCGGLDGLGPSTRVMIKPNLVTWNDRHRIAPFGVFTTTRLVEDLVILLKEAGCADITIGEGSVQMFGHAGTREAFAGLGYPALARRYGVRLVDFNVSRARRFPLPEGHVLQVAAEAVDCDFLIDVPVLKTHPQTRVSLGLKNLKGCLKRASKQACHGPELDLEQSFSHVADFIPPALTVVDAIYVLELGPLHHGNAYRRDLIVASRDVLAADLVAARTVGIDGGDVPHFAHYARRHARPLDLSDCDLRGERLEDHVAPLTWDWPWTADDTGPELFEQMGISGVAVRKYDETLCTGCTPVPNVSGTLVASAFRGAPLPKVEILYGKRMLGRPGYDKTVLLGSCIIRANRDNPDINAAVEVRGCPPSYEAILEGLQRAGLEVDDTFFQAYTTQQSEKYRGREGYDEGFYGCA